MNNVLFVEKPSVHDTIEEKHEMKHVKIYKKEKQTTTSSVLHML